MKLIRNIVAAPFAILAAILGALTYAALVMWSFVSGEAL